MFSPDKKKKLAKPNGFLLYMKERRPAVESSGVKLPRGFASLAPLLEKEWKELPKEEKEKYLGRAKSEKGRLTLENKTNEVEEQKEKKMARAYHITPQQRNRSHVWRLLQNENWKDRRIVICSFNTFSGSTGEGGQVIPAEIGLVTFSIEKGIVDSFGRLIDPAGVSPMTGWVVDREARELGVPYPGQIGKEFQDYNAILCIVESFLTKYTSYIVPEEFCVFALDSEYEKTSKCFQWLNKHSAKKIQIEVFSLSLFAQLASTNTVPCLNSRLNERQFLIYNHQAVKEFLAGKSRYKPVASNRRCGKPLTKVFIYPDAYPFVQFGFFLKEYEVDRILESSDNYKYYTELCCLYHFKKEDGVGNCALSRVNRMAFYILDVVTMSVEVSQLLPGSHFPNISHPEEDMLRRHSWLDKWGITKQEKKMEIAPPYEEVHVPRRPTPSGKSSFRQKRFGEEKKEDRLEKQRGTKPEEPSPNCSQADKEVILGENPSPNEVENEEDPELIRGVRTIFTGPIPEMFTSFPANFDLKFE